MPVGAFGGPRKMMAHLAPDGDTYQAGTLSGNPGGNGRRHRNAGCSLGEQRLAEARGAGRRAGGVADAGAGEGAASRCTYCAPDRSSGCHFTRGTRRARAAPLDATSLGALRCAVPRHAGARRLPAAFGLRGVLPRPTAFTARRTLQSFRRRRCEKIALREPSHCAMKATRVFQITALLLVIVVGRSRSAGGSMISRTTATQKLREARARYAREVARGAGSCWHPACPRRARAGIAARRGDRRRDARASVSRCRCRHCSPSAIGASINTRGRAAFFLLALALCVAVIWRALARGDSSAPGAGQLPRARLAPVQDAAGKPAALAGDHGKATLSPEQARTLIDRMLVGLGPHGGHGHADSRQRAPRARPGGSASEPLDLAGAVTRVVAQFEERARKDNITVSDGYAARPYGAHRSAGAGRRRAQSSGECASRDQPPWEAAASRFVARASGERDRARGARQRRRVSPRDGVTAL